MFRYASRDLLSPIDEQRVQLRLIDRRVRVSLHEPMDAQAFACVYLALAGEIVQPPGVNQAGRGKFEAGRVTRKVVPMSGWLLASIRPPWASQIDLEMESPKPQPPCSRDRALSIR